MPAMRPAGTRRLPALLALAAAIVVAIVVCGPVGLLLLPALLLGAALLLGRYPGEELINRFARRPRAARRTLWTFPVPRAPRSLGARLAPLATLGASRAPPLTV